MAVRVGINGFGRIGRITFRALAARPKEFEVVAVNDLGDPKHLAMLLKYDSVQGRFPGTVQVEGNNLIVNGKTIRVCAEKDPGKLPWKELGVEVALESTGFFTGRKTDAKPGYDSHLAAGARKVVLSAPAKDEPDLTVVLGVNDNQLTKEHKCVSNASCTTNCLAPMAKVLHESLRNRAGTDDDGPRLHERSAGLRSAPFRSAPRGPPASTSFPPRPARPRPWDWCCPSSRGS